MKTNEIRKKYLKYFEQNGHVVYPSDSLIPGNDPTLLFTGAGMNQFKDMFVGAGDLNFKRATTCQKCLRTGDIDNVGRTSSHHTFFEMLGNFSFGDYFKEEVINWAWEFVRKEICLPEERLSVSVYRDDNESYRIWNKKMGVSSGKIYKFGESDNFWPANAPSKGPNGPCGPCTEIFYDQGENIGCKKPECNPSCDCDRYVEIWNLVLMQYKREEGGKLTPLENKCIDTGMGLERVARITQGVLTNFEIDIFEPVIKNIEELLGVNYNANPVSSRQVKRIADHVRAIVFCIADGVYFGNEGRGYVGRRLLRRAMRDVIELGKNETLLYKLVPVIADVMEEPYPELKSRRENIAKIIKNEEERFQETIESGTHLLNEYIDKMESGNESTLSGKDAFRLYDTFGFPLDMTVSILNEKGLCVDKTGFDAEMEKQREQARSKTQIVSSVFSDGSKTGENEKGTEFKGYAADKIECTVQQIIFNKDFVDIAEKDQEVLICLDKTPFYAEAGGQVGDQGVLHNNECRIEVKNTLKENGKTLHVCRVIKGNINCSDVITAEIDTDRRNAIKRNHSAAHILHYFLRKVLGQHAEQAGSMVSNDRLRFDFRHFANVSKDELERIEYLVNEKILDDEEVVTKEMNFKEAIDSGVTALFGEKYGEFVRAVNIGKYSRELCGGTHVSRTGNIGLFKITGESSIAAGIRRIEAITGLEALKRARKKECVISELCGVLNTNEGMLYGRVKEILRQIKDNDKEISKLKQQAGSGMADKLISDAKEVSGVKIVVAKIEKASITDLRNTADSLRKASGSVAVVLGSSEDSNVVLIAALSNEVVKRGLHAGKIVKEVAKIVEGGGGGNAEIAQAGGKNVSKLANALSGARKLIEEALIS
ncbi:MAG: alanine--tRNA ligase [Candidatus Anammoxibacter sp.]